MLYSCTHNGNGGCQMVNPAHVTSEQQPRLLADYRFRSESVVNDDAAEVT